MVVKSVTKEELLESELRIKKENTDLRHADRNKMQGIVDDVDNLKVDNALLKQSLEAMKSEITEVKDEVKMIRSDFQSFEKNLFDKLDQRFASKTTEKIVFGMVGLILTSVFVALIALVIK